MTRVFLVALGFLLLPEAVAGQNEGPRGRSEVTDIRFVGNPTFPTDTLKRAIVNRATECRTAFLKPLCAAGVDFALDRHYFNLDEFARDAIRVRLFYWQRGFREAAVDTASDAPKAGKIELALRVTEGRPVLVDSISVVGGEDIEGPVPPGQPAALGGRSAQRDRGRGYARFAREPLTRRGLCIRISAAADRAADRVLLGFSDLRRRSRTARTLRSSRHLRKSGAFGRRRTPYDRLQ